MIFEWKIWGQELLKRESSVKCDGELEKSVVPRCHLHFQPSLLTLENTTAWLTLKLMNLFIVKIYIFTWDCVVLLLTFMMLLTLWNGDHMSNNIHQCYYQTSQYKKTSIFWFLVVTTHMCLHRYAWYPLGIGSRTPEDTKAHTHSSPFVKNCIELA